jgi:hypothetical protein
VALCGVGELAEIAALCNAEFHLDLVVVAPDAAKRVAGLAAAPDLEAAGRVDAAIVTDLAEPQAIFEALKARLAPERIFTPRLLRVSRNGAGKV